MYIVWCISVCDAGEKCNRFLDSSEDWNRPAPTMLPTRVAGLGLVLRLYPE